ncbi:Hydrolase [Erysiphe necator]|uniref:Putative dienelactone hydrolase family protein n=1 Tax=Uncinula necator TaxID=52586 RepID=A0A0B1P7Z7_UNCNE|nr:Hydrolase [Erysiphe necator]KHJ33086.1 putative dienelactone hydrolase family protein [Erysiphe necator]
MSDSKIANLNDARDAHNLVEESLDPPELGHQELHSAGLGEHCVVDRPSPSDQRRLGKIRKLGDVDVYISRPSTDSSKPLKFLLFLTGATGLHSVNNQIQADNFAKQGFLVVLPDMFADDPLPGSATYEEAKDPSVIDAIKLRLAETAKSFLVDMWLARQTPQKVIPILMKVIEAAKDEFANEIANGDGIYSVGYCFGGRITLLLAGEKPDRFPTIPWIQQVQDEESSPVNTGPYIKAGAIFHATLVTKEDFRSIKSPLCFICVENDQLFPEDIKQYGEQSLKYDRIDCEFKTYTDVPHGFGVVGEYENARIKAAQADAFDHALSWLQRH